MSKVHANRFSLATLQIKIYCFCHVVKYVINEIESQLNISGSVQDTNGNPANRGFEPTPSNSSGASRSAITGNNLGARPKVRRNVINSIDQVVPNENHEENGAEENDDNNSDEDFYVYR